MPDLLDLADKCAKSSGPDRQIDGLIYRAVNNVPEWKRGPNMFGHIEGPNGEIIDSPHYTLSIDAAITIIPAGWTRAVDASAPEQGIDVDLFPPDALAETVEEIKASHLSEPIATCLAALRARASALTSKEQS